MGLLLLIITIVIASTSMYAFISAFKASDDSARFGWCFFSTVLGCFTAASVSYLIFDIILG